MREGPKIVVVIAIFVSITAIGFLLRRLDPVIAPSVALSPEVSDASPRSLAGPGSNPGSSIRNQAAQAASSPLDEVLRAARIAREEHELQVGFESLERFPETDWNTESLKEDIVKQPRIRPFAFIPEKAELLEGFNGRLRAIEYLKAKQAQGLAPGRSKATLDPVFLNYDALDHERRLSRQRERRALQILLNFFPDPEWSWDRFNTLSVDVRQGMRSLSPGEATVLKVFEEWYRAKEYHKDSGWAPIYGKVSSVILRDVQGLWGGENLYLSRDGTTYIQIVKPPKEVYPQGGLHEQRFKLTLSNGDVEAVLTLLSTNDYFHLEINDRPGVPDEGRPTLLVHFSIGFWKTVAKWSGDKDDRFDAIYTHLRAFVKKTSEMKPIYDGRYEGNWKPEGFETPR